MCFGPTLRTYGEHLLADETGIENFLGQRTIKDEGKIYTASGDGKIPFVSTTDIAAVAFRALTDEKPHNTSYFVLGPELLTYDQVYRLFGSKTRMNANADRLHTDCSEIQHQSGTRGRARQTLRGRTSPKVPE